MENQCWWCEWDFRDDTAEQKTMIYNEEKMHQTCYEAFKSYHKIKGEQEQIHDPQGD